MDANSTELENIEIYTSDEILELGLKYLGWDETNMTSRLTTQTKKDRFRGLYGSDPHVAAQMWADLQTTTVEAARIDPSKRNLQHYCWAMHFLKKYPNSSIEAEQMWKVSENTYVEHSWYYVQKLRALKAVKLCWPSDNFGDDIWIGTVDGTHFHNQEIAHPYIPKDPSIFSFKHQSAGFNYEIVVALRESKIVWFSGPHEAGDWNDIKIFAHKGLRAKLKRLRKRVIADKGYRGYPKLISLPNSYDTKEVSKFKSRARCRQEKLNGKIAEFECMNNIGFRHSKAKLQACFEAVAVIVQYKMEMGEPLYDI